MPTNVVDEQDKKPAPKKRTTRKKSTTKTKAATAKRTTTRRASAKQAAENSEKFYGSILLAIFMFQVLTFFVLVMPAMQKGFLNGAHGFYRSSAKNWETHHTAKWLYHVMALPKDAKIQAGTIPNAHELIEANPFYRGAVDGDHVVIYPELNLVVVFRPSIQRIVKVGPADIGIAHALDSVQQVIESETNGVDDSFKFDSREVDPAVNGGQMVLSNHAAVLSVDLREGTQAVDKFADAHDALDDLSDIVALTTVASAAHARYLGTLVYVADANKKSDPQIETIRQAVRGIIIDELPSNETPSDADIVVIVGGR